MGVWGVSAADGAVPCPFCGSADTSWTFKADGIDGRLRFFCFCWECRAQGPEAASQREALAQLEAAARREGA